MSEVLSRTKVDPIIFLGLDVATKRDTCALVGVTPDEKFDEFLVWGARIWEPPVNLVTQVYPVIKYIFETFAVAGLWFDPYQAVTLTQQLRADGHGHRLIEVNQQTQMTSAANTMHSVLTENRLDIGEDPKDLRAHFSYASAKQTERGWRIIKLVQTRKIDAVIALAMALHGATEESGHGTYPAWQSKMHARNPFVFEGVAA
jgi:phage terminase large subunit-like protein